MRGAIQREGESLVRLHVCVCVCVFGVVVEGEGEAALLRWMIQVSGWRKTHTQSLDDDT